MERRDKVNYYLDLAEMVSQRSTCLRKHYGAVIVNNDEVISTELMNDITTTIWNILHAPEYLQILDEYIMWDCDYLLLEDIGMENMLCLLKEPAFVNELGLVESSDQCEPITGSIKRAICEQKK